RRPAPHRNRSLTDSIRSGEGEFTSSLAAEPPLPSAGRDRRAEALETAINAQERLLGLARGMDEDRRDSAAALESSFADEPELQLVGDGLDDEEMVGDAEAPAAWADEPEPVPEPPPVAPP